MRRRIIFTNLFVFLIFLVSCKENISYDVKEIHSIVIDRTIIPRPITLSLEENEILISKKSLDSLKRISLDIAICKIDHLPISDFKNVIVSDEYKLITKDFFTDKIHNLYVSKKNIGSFTGHRLTIISEDLAQNKKLLFKDFHQIVYLSKINFNKKHDRAVIYVITSYLFLLKKENKKWKIDSKKELSIS